MEIGKLAFTAVEPLKAVHHELIESRVQLFIACTIIYKLSQKKWDTQFAGFKRDWSIGNTDVRITDVVKLLAGADIQFHLQNAQWLEKLFLQLSLLCLGNIHHTRQPSFHLREEVHDQLVFTVFNSTEHNGLCLGKHNAKVGKNKKIKKWENEKFMNKTHKMSIVKKNVKRIISHFLILLISHFLVSLFQINQTEQ